LPAKIFGHLNRQRGNPTYNVAIVGVLAYAGTLTMQWERSVEILNFGALVAFMAVNVAVLRHFGFPRDLERKRNVIFDVVVPALGFLFCLIIFLGLQGSTLVIGAAWVLAGILYVIVKTRELGEPVMIDFSES
jgi:putrescine importer